jgi:N-acetylneuraminate lyase
MKKHKKLTELVAAPHTPFNSDGALHLVIVEKQAAHLLKNGIATVFIGGNTGECHSLSLTERQQLAQRWMEVTRGTNLRVVIHVGSNCLPDAKALAAQAGQLRASAIAALAPSYFKPRSLAALIDVCAGIAAAAPDTPFYYYDIPVLTGVSLSMPDFLAQASDHIPTLAGIKFTNPDLMSYQLCLRADGGRFDVPYGTDEWLLAALALGARGAVGSTYNFAASIFHRLLKAFADGDLAQAREEQFRAVQLIRLLVGYGYMGAAKATMKILGVDVGPPRLPNETLSAPQIRKLRRELEELGFFEWIQP